MMPRRESPAGPAGMSRVHRSLPSASAWVLVLSCTACTCARLLINQMEGVLGGVGQAAGGCSVPTSVG